MISDFSREVVENCTILENYAVSSGIFLPTFRDDQSVSSSRVTNPINGFLAFEEKGLTGCPETTVRNYHYLLCNSPEWRSSYNSRGYVRLWPGCHRGGPLSFDAQDTIHSSLV